MSLMLSKHYILFKNIFSFFYESEFTIISIIFGIFSILHGLLMVYRSIRDKQKREFIEALIVIVAGVILLSPEFNTMLTIPLISQIPELHHEIVSHLAIALVPIIILYLWDIFISRRTD